MFSVIFFSFFVIRCPFFHRTRVLNMVNLCVRCRHCEMIQGEACPRLCLRGRVQRRDRRHPRRKDDTDTEECFTAKEVSLVSHALRWWALCSC